MFFLIRAAALVPLYVLCTAALGQALDARWTVYAQAGRGLENQYNPRAAALGLTGPLDWTWHAGTLRVTTYWDAHISSWRAPSASQGHRSFAQLGFIPSARVDLATGNSPWFFDAGIGITYLDGIYATPKRAFSTRLNFTEFIGLGIRFGAQESHEIALRVQHYSNGGVRKPNPGEDFVQFRYAARF